MTELHGLSSSRPFVQQGSVGHWHAGDVTNHGLVVEERLQATLRDFGLVGCVLSYPDNGTGTVSRAAWFRTRGQQHKSRGRRRRGSGQWNALCDFLMLEICRKSKNHLASHEWRSQGLWLKAASLNYSNFISYFRCSEGSVICQHSPAWIFQQIALDGRRYWAVVVTHADVGPPHFVHRCDLLQGLQDLILACQVFQKVKLLHHPTHKYLSSTIVYEQHSSAGGSAWHGMTLINHTYICSLFQNSFKWKHATFHSPFSRDNSDKCTHPFITYFQLFSTTHWTLCNCTLSLWDSSDFLGCLAT